MVLVQFWKSNPMYWCDYCKVWMQDNPQARATHEKGIKHKDNVARSDFPSMHLQQRPFSSFSLRQTDMCLYSQSCVLCVRMLTKLQEISGWPRNRWARLKHGLASSMNRILSKPKRHREPRLESGYGNSCCCADSVSLISSPELACWG